MNMESLDNFVCLVTEQSRQLATNIYTQGLQKHLAVAETQLGEWSSFLSASEWFNTASSIASFVALVIFGVIAFIVFLFSAWWFLWM